MAVERNLMNIQVGDFISYYGVDYEVYAVIDWMEEGFTWKEYKLKDNGNTAWISAEVDDGEIIAYFFTMVDDFDIKLPAPNKIRYDNTIFELEEKGSAVGKLKGKHGDQQLQCNYYEYEAKDRLFSIEQYGNDLEISVGVLITQRDIDILPGG